MRIASGSRRLVAATFIAAALVPAASAQADAPQEQCDARLDRLVAQFYDMAHTSCVMH